MRNKDLYKKDIERNLNPAVSAEDFTASTINTEIDEYVFTDDIINGLYRVLTAIHKHNVSHNGIWINGFFGSGKSHFLKYLGYCTNPQTRERALARFREAVYERDPLQNNDSKSEVTPADFNSLANWIGSATFDIVQFNIGAVHNAGGDQRQVFTQVLWNQFNKLRGYNADNLALAQHLEKLLDENGQFEAFKQRLAADGFDWEREAGMLSIVYLDRLLDIAKELMPGITTDSIRNAILNSSVNLSPDSFCHELADYINAKKDSNYRLLFLADEVSQFIGNNTQLLLQLQEIVTGLSNICADKVWLACTAQQDLSLLMSNMQIQKTNDDYGRIMGRFQVRVSFIGDKTEFITQKRLLDKNDSGQLALHNLYESKRLAIENQFSLPTSFRSFTDETEFINYYPFVPYQFHLLQLVLSSFNAKKYIDVESSGNERSVIKVTHRTAQSNMDEELGSLVPFDSFYNAISQGALTNVGQRAVSNAENMVGAYDGDQSFARRVVNTLFMICNLTDSNKLLFPATRDNIVTLLMRDIDSNRQQLAEQTGKALSFLYEKHIIRIEKDAKTQQNVYCFQSEDEIEAEREIENIHVDNTMMADSYRELFARHFGSPNNRERFCSGNFSVGWSIYGRNFLTTGNPDVIVEFAISGGQETSGFFGASAEPRKLIFNVWQELQNDRQLQNDLYYYCQVREFAKKPRLTTTRSETVERINERTKALYEETIVRKMQSILNRCELRSAGRVINVDGQGQARYHNALGMHLANLYPFAKLTVSDYVPGNAEELRKAILRPVQPGEYGEQNPMGEAEKQVEQYINQHIGPLNVEELFTHFSTCPFGWPVIATAYFLNELCRRQLRSLKYNNAPSPDNQTIAQNLLGKSSLFTIHQAAAIPQELVNNFIKAWRDIFNTHSMGAATDSAELMRKCKETLPGERHVSIASTLKALEERKEQLSGLPLYNAFDEQIELLRSWREERDTRSFFEKVIADEQKARALFDKGKDIVQFIDDRLPEYKKIRQFAIDNKDNFNFLADKSLVEQLMPIVDDPCPMQNMRRYIPASDALSQELKAKKDEMKEDIKQRYCEVIDELVSIAAERQATYNVNKDSVIAIRTASDNLYVLDKARDTSSFRESEIRKITEQTAGRTVRMLRLSTTSKAPLNNEAAVDAYLATLKMQLMAALNVRKDNEDLMVN